MSQSNLEKQEARLKALNQKIKDEKNRIEQFFLNWKPRFKSSATLRGSSD